MPIVVEDGTGMSDANSYGSVAEADAYFIVRGNDEWALLTADQKSAALIRATDYIEVRFSERFYGRVAAEGQALSFPRSEWGVVGIIPRVLKYATFEYALRAAQSPLAPDAKVDPTGQLVLKTVEKVGPIDEEITYQNPATSSSFYASFRPYLAADALIAKLLRRSSGVMRA